MTTPSSGRSQQRQQQYFVDPTMYKEMGHDKRDKRPNVALDKFDESFSGHQPAGGKKKNLTPQQKRRLKQLRMDQTMNPDGPQLSDSELIMAAQVLEPSDRDKDPTLMTNNPALQQLVQKHQGRSMNGHQAMDKVKQDNPDDPEVGDGAERAKRETSYRRDKKVQRAGQWAMARGVGKAVVNAIIPDVVQAPFRAVYNGYKKLKNIGQMARQKGMQRELGRQGRGFDPQQMQQQLAQSGGMDQRRMQMQEQMGMQQQFAMGMGGGQFQQMQMMQMQQMMMQMQMFIQQLMQQMQGPQRQQQMPRRQMQQQMDVPPPPDTPPPPDKMQKTPKQRSAPRPKKEKMKMEEVEETPTKTTTKDMDFDL